MNEDKRETIISTGSEGTEILNEMLSGEEVKLTEEETNIDEELIDTEEEELTEEEKKELYIKALKESRIKYKPVTHKGNKTINKFGTDYKKKKRKKNKAVKKSRKANRRK